MRGVFVTGTDTGAGKTVVAGVVAAGLRARGLRVAASKPVLTGLDEPPGPQPPDHELLAAAAGTAPQDVAPLRFGPPVSPHLAAELAGTSIGLDDLLANVEHAVREAGPAIDALVVEGVGGLLVPLGPGVTVRELALALALPVVVAARTGLGTISHTLLTVDAARAAGLDVRAVVLGPWPAEPSAIERSNRTTIAELARIEVHVLPHTAPGPEALAAAGGALPLERWLGDAPSHR